MIIGSSRVGIGRIGIREAGTTLSLTTNASIIERLLTGLTTNASVVDIYTIDFLTSAEILDWYQRTFTTNASIIVAMDLGLPTNANIAELIALGLPTNAYIIQTESISFTTNSSIQAPALLSFSTNAAISGLVDLLFHTNAYIALQDLLEFLTNAYISENKGIDFSTNAQIGEFHGVDFTTNANIFDNRYWALGPEGQEINLSGKVYDPEANGFGIRTSRQRVPEWRRVNLLDEGLEGGEWSFTIAFRSDSERHIFQTLVNNDSEDLIFYHGRSDRYHRVKRISVEPPGEDELWKGMTVLKVTCFMEDPYIYHVIDQGLDIGSASLPITSTSKYNDGTVKAPLLFRVGGVYLGGLQLTNPYVILMNGATEERSLYLGPGLLSAEYAELTLDGWNKFYLTHGYADDYSTNNFWQYDRVHSGCSLASGQVSVPSGAWFYYKFQGYPLKKNIKLLATITKSGSPLIQYSTDGSIWNTAISASEISTGIQKEYWLTGTDKQTTVYVRFYSPTGSSMTVQDVSFEMLRDISAQYDQIPSILPGETRALKFTGSGSAKAKTKTTFRARWQPA